MPNITIKVPEDVFDAASRQKIAFELNKAAKLVEQIGDSPANEFFTWILFEDIKPGYLFAGGADPSEMIIPVVVWMRYPEGVIEQTGREKAAKLIHDIIADAAPKNGRPVIASIAVEPVGDGAWAGRGGGILRLADFARAAGYKHLQHLVPGAAA